MVVLWSLLSTYVLSRSSTGGLYIHVLHLPLDNFWPGILRQERYRPYVPRSYVIMGALGRTWW